MILNLTSRPTMRKGASYTQVAANTEHVCLGEAFDSTSNIANSSQYTAYRPPNPQIPVETRESIRTTTNTSPLSPRVHSPLNEPVFINPAPATPIALCLYTTEQVEAERRTRPTFNQRPNPDSDHLRKPRHVREPWETGYLKRFPWKGTGSLLVVLLCP